MTPAAGRPLVLGVLNATPDSFSDGGRFLSSEAAIAQARLLLAQGADVIDVGGESTRPGAIPVPRDEELARVIPVVAALVAEGATVSIDTIHAETAVAAVAAGARFINDVSGGLHDPDMLAVAAQASRAHGASYIAGHWRGIPDPAHRRSDYADVVAEVRAALAERVAAALAAGVDRSHLVIDPGLGFDKTGEQCWELLRRIGELRSLGFPVLIGASRKRMLGEVLEAVPGAARKASDGAGDAFVERDLATAVVSALAAREGVWGVRVHDVASTVAALAVERAWGASARQLPAQPQGHMHGGDRITLTGLEAFAHHGVFDFERERGQRFLLDVEISVDLAAAAAGDDLASTVHYGELAAAVVAAVERDPVDLIETVAERVVGVALGFTGVRIARVTVHKPDAPIAAPFADVSVTMVRGREGA